MKKFISVLVIGFGFSAIAAENIQPNLYVCNGPGNTQVSFSRTSLVGKPQLNVRLGSAAVPQGAVNLQRTTIGELATISDNRMAAVDGPMLRYTLVIPAVILNDQAAPEKFSTIFVKTSLASLFRAPNFSGATQTNEVTSVECSAERVFSITGE